MSCNKNIRQQLLAIISNDDFFIELDKLYFDSLIETKDIGVELATLHNEGKINVISKFLTVKGALNTDTLYNITYIFNDTLPNLNASVADTLECIRYLTLEAGSDISPNSLSTYCDKQKGRPNDVLSASLTNVETSIDFISIALISGAKSDLDSFVNKAIKLTNHENELVKTRALFALGVIDYSENSGLVEDVLNVFEAVLKLGHSDSLYSSIIQSIFSIYFKDKTRETNIIKLLKISLKNPGVDVLNVVSRVFGLNSKDIPESSMDLFFYAFVEISPSNTIALKNVDRGLAKLLKSSDKLKAVYFLEKLLLINKGDISILTFTAFLNELVTNDINLLNTLTTRWFLSKKMLLGKAISEIICKRENRKIELSVDKLLLKNVGEGSCLFLAQKACAWFFMSPISAVSFILSLIEYSTEDEIVEINDIIFNPLLMSYFGSINKYLEVERNTRTHREKKSIKSAQESITQYHQGLEGAWKLKELRPSIAQREAHQRKHNEEFNKAYKENSKGSFLSSLFGKPRVLLYGNTSIYKVHGLNESTQRQEAPLSSIRTSVELPSLQALDPHGIDNKLWFFKTDGCTE